MWRRTCSNRSSPLRERKETDSGCLPYTESFSRAAATSLSRQSRIKARRSRSFFRENLRSQLHHKQVISGITLNCLVNLVGQDRSKSLGIANLIDTSKRRQR